METMFDFESVELRESPCKRCRLKAMIPECIKSCELIHGIQKTLAGRVISTISVSAGEAYSISQIQ